MKLAIILIISSVITVIKSADIDSKLLNEARERGLEEHNMYRKTHQAPDLVIDSKINDVAHNYANYLASQNLFMHSNGSDYGENLYRYGTSRALSDDIVLESVEKATDAWYNEVKDYDFDTPQFSEKTGHFTQVIWKESKNVGFGVAVRKDNKGFTWVYVVANYSPPGNVKGHFKQNVLLPETE